jgi:hypothetical protein
LLSTSLAGIDTTPSVTWGSIRVAFIGRDGVVSPEPEQPAITNGSESNRTPTIMLLDICLFPFLSK